MAGAVMLGSSPGVLSERPQQGTLTYRPVQQNQVVAPRKGRKALPTAFDTPEANAAAEQGDKENAAPAPAGGPSPVAGPSSGGGPSPYTMEHLRPLPSRTQPTPPVSVTPATPPRAPVVTTASPAGPPNPVVLEDSAPSTAVAAEDSRHVGNDVSQDWNPTSLKI
jgi:hypothetical protein